jgi:hypothetical protein
MKKAYASTSLYDDRNGHFGGTVTRQGTPKQSADGRQTMTGQGFVTINGHRYPSRYAPGTHWAVDKAWQILDKLPDDALTDAHRFLLGGMIAGALIETARARKLEESAP